MAASSVEISVKGRWRPTPAVEIARRHVVASGGFPRTAAVHDAEWLERELEDPRAVIDGLRAGGAADLRADIFTFAQRLPDTRPRYSYPMELDKVAAIRLDDPKDWWENRLPQETRKNVRRSVKRGLVVRVVDFDDDLLRGIVAINDESKMRQGKPFHHYGKSVEEVRKDYSSFLDRAKFIGAFCGDELVGVIQIIYMGGVAAILELLIKSSHYDKRPANALIAQAVEVCASDGLSHLTYGKYTYGNKGSDNPLTEFKRRNGFEEFPVPRYYVPLTPLGHLCIAFKLHRGLLGILPEKVISSLLNVRKMWYKVGFVRKPV